MFLLSVFGFIFFVLSLNPYVGIFNLQSDQQPFVHLLSIPLFLIFIFFARIDKVSMVLFFPLFLVFVLLILSPEMNSFRSAYNYISFFIVFFVALSLFKSTKINFNHVLLLTFWLWFFVGFVQLFYADFLLFLVNNPRTTEGRGVTSLATEPTYYGIVMLFYILFFKLSEIRFKSLYIFLCSFAVLFIAKSAMAALFLFLYLFVVSFFGRYWSIRFLYLTIFFSIPFIFQYLPDSRMKQLISSIFDDPVKVVLVDASVNDRFFHVFLPIKGFFENLGLPYGFSSFVDYSTDQIGIYSTVIIVEWFSVSGRIMSGLGSALFELGFFGLIYIFLPIYILYPLRIHGMSLFISTLFLYFVIFVSAVPVGFTFFPVFLAFVYYKTRYLNAR